MQPPSTLCFGRKGELSKLRASKAFARSEQCAAKAFWTGYCVPVIDDALLSPAQESAWARAQICMNLGKADDALEHLRAAVDWDCDLYRPAVGYDGWTVRKSDFMVPGWLYLDPKAGESGRARFILVHPETADLVFYNSGTTKLVATFDSARVYVRRVDENERATAMESSLQDMIYQETIPLDED